MINCIIYEDNEKMQELYQKIINDFFEEKNILVSFCIYDKYKPNLEDELFNIIGEKIYILDIEVPGKSGLDLARIIRNSGDWNSPLIIVTSYEHLKNKSFTSKMLMLDFVSKKENIELRLKESLELANVIIDNNETYTFQYNGELYHIEYKNILYFKKDLNDNYTFLYTKKNIFKIKESIIQIENIIKDNKSFVKTHRSCIVNIDNIEYFDIKNNIIYFKEYSTNLLTKESRDFLKKILRNDQIKK